MPQVITRPVLRRKSEDLVLEDGEADAEEDVGKVRVGDQVARLVGRQVYISATQAQRLRGAQEPLESHPRQDSRREVQVRIGRMLQPQRNPRSA